MKRHGSLVAATVGMLAVAGCSDLGQTDSDLDYVGGDGQIIIDRAGGPRRPGRGHR